MKILNLFAGIGGNRKNWEGNITAIEIYDYIEEKGSKTVEQLAKQFKIKNSEVISFLQELLRNNLIIKEKNQYRVRKFEEYTFT